MIAWKSITESLPGTMYVVALYCLAVLLYKFEYPSKHFDSFQPLQSGGRLLTCCHELHRDPHFSDFGQEKPPGWGVQYGPSTMAGE